MAGGNDIQYQGPRIANDRAVVTLDEVQQGETQAPTGTEPYTVKPGDTLWEIARDNGYGNPPDMDAFYQHNPQYNEAERNPDLIWPGEVVFVKVAAGEAPDADADGVADPATDTDNDGRPDPVNSEQAQATTDAAAQDVEDAEQAQQDYMRGPGPKGLRQDYEDAVTNARQRLNDALQAEVEQGLETYVAANPNASADQIRTEAERLANAAQGRSGAATEISDDTIDRIVQDAINNVSAAGAEPPMDLDRVSPGTDIRPGPYSSTHGPFEPNSTVTMRDGSEVHTDENGYPVGAAGQAALAPSPADPQAATSSAADSYGRALDLPAQLSDRDEFVSDSRKRLTEAVQRETEMELQQWLDANPGATEDEVRAQATEIVEGIQQREGANVVGEDMASTAAEQAANVVLSNRYN